MREALYERFFALGWTFFFLILAGCVTGSPKGDLPPTSPAERSKEESPLHAQSKKESPAAQESLRPGKGIEGEKKAPFHPEGPSRPIASVEGFPIYPEDFVDLIFILFQKEAFSTLHQLIQNRIIDLEAEEAKVTVQEEAVERETAVELENWRNSLRIQYSGEVTLEDLLERTGRNIEKIQKSLTQAVRYRLLLERLLRFSQITSERAEIRRIVLNSRDKAEEVLEKLTEGADFERIAKSESITPCSREGGRLPPVERGFLHPLVEKYAFSLKEGEKSPIIETREGEETRYHIIRVIRQVPARRVSYREVEEEILKGLKEKPVEEVEYICWNQKMAAKYGIILHL